MWWPRRQLQRRAADAGGERRAAREQRAGSVDEAALEAEVSRRRQRGDAQGGRFGEPPLAERQLVAGEAALADPVADRQDVRQPPALARRIERAEHEQQERVGEALIQRYEDRGDSLEPGRERGQRLDVEHGLLRGRGGIRAGPGHRELPDDRSSQMEAPAPGPKAGGVDLLRAQRVHPNSGAAQASRAQRVDPVGSRELLRSELSVPGRCRAALRRGRGGAADRAALRTAVQLIDLADRDLAHQPAYRPRLAHTVRRLRGSLAQNSRLPARGVTTARITDLSPLTCTLVTPRCERR